MHQYTIDSLNKCLFSPVPIGLLPENKDGWTNEYLSWDVLTNSNISRQLNENYGWRFVQGTGKVQGRLIGGCVEVLKMIYGTEIWPELSVWDNAILFLETSEEGMEPNAFMYFLRNLGAQRILQTINGILFSKPGGHLMQSPDFEKYDTCLLKVLREFDRGDMPVVTGMDFGHTDPMMTLPIGRNAEIDVESRFVSIFDSAVE